MHITGTTDGNSVTNGDIVRLANETDPEVDVIFSGHSHTYVNGTVNNKLVVQANSYGMAFADVDVKIDRKTQDIVEKKQKLLQLTMKAWSLIKNKEEDGEISSKNRTSC